MSWQDWPVYSQECRGDMHVLLSKGGSLSAYQANKNVGLGPRENSWAWRAERLLEEAHGVKHAILCSNGTVALEILVQAMGQQMWLVPALTFSATVHGGGGWSMFGDVTIPECTLDPSQRYELPALPVDLFGRQAEGFGKETIHDSCQAIGLRPLSNHGVWSFNGRKQVPAGEGGAIYTNSDEVADQCRHLINHQENFEMTSTSGNGRVSEQTALLIYHGLLELPQRQGHRLAMAARLNQYLTHYWYGDPPLCPPVAKHAMYIYPLIVSHSMPALAHVLKQMGVACQPGYIQPTLDQYPAFADNPKGKLTNTHSLSRDRLILFPQITPTTLESEVDELGEQIVKAWRKIS